MDETKETKYLVVSKLPEVETRNVNLDGEETELITTNEAIQEILEKVRKMSKAL